MRHLISPVFAAAAAASLAVAGFAADPQPYQLDISSTGDGALDAVLHDMSLLESLRDKTPAPPFALIDRARGDATRFQTALESFGYYKGKAAITIAGHDLTDRTLPDALEEVPQGQSVDVKVMVERGQRYALRKVVVDGTVPETARAALGIKPGDPAIAADVLAGQTRLQNALEEDGYAFAKVEPPIATADDAGNVLDVTYKAEPGAHVAIGRISFKGLEHVNESFVREALTVHKGDPYKPSAIEAARSGLVGLGVFSGVSVQGAQQAEADGTVPLTFEVQERARHAVAFSGTYSTDLGVNISARWSHRNLLGNAERLNLSAAGTSLGGTATAGIGYNLSAQFIKPRFLKETQELELNLAAVKQQLDAYSQQAETFSVHLRREFSQMWRGTAGFVATHDRVKQQDEMRVYTLLALPFTAIYNSTELSDPLADPTSGARATLSLTPTMALGARTVPFAVIQLSGSMYFDLSGDGRTVLAMRAMVGSIQGGSNVDLPPDQRLYAGGSGTVRGFRYQSIGPYFADGSPAGATSMDAVSLEIRQRLWSNWGMAAFIDAGQASTKNIPLNGEMEIGAGAGVRYYTPIGAVRLDVAVPVTSVPKGDAFEIYISLGQAF